MNKIVPNLPDTPFPYTREDVNTVQSFLAPLAKQSFLEEESLTGMIKTLRIAIKNSEKAKETEAKELSEQEILESKTHYLTPKEVCQRLSISKPTFYKLVKAGKLRIIKLETASRVPEIDLMNLQKTKEED